MEEIKAWDPLPHSELLFDIVTLKDQYDIENHTIERLIELKYDGEEEISDGAKVILDRRIISCQERAQRLAILLEKRKK